MEVRSAGYDRVSASVVRIDGTGEGGEPDHVRAYFWYFHSARGGVERAIEMRDVIATTLTQDQREALSRIAGEVERVRREPMDR